MRGPERDADVLAHLEAAMASRWAWAKQRGGARDAVLRQRMADVWIEHAVAMAVLAEGSGTGALVGDRVERCLRVAEEEIRRSRGAAEVLWMREELAVRRRDARIPSVREPDEADHPVEPDDWQRFCREVVRPAARLADRTEHVGDEVWAALAERGYLQRFHEAAPAALYPAMLALAEACAATFWKATISSALCGKMIASFAQPAVAARWLPGLASGRSVGVFAASERGSGSDPHSYAARLVRRGNGWTLSGEKDRISNACDAHVAAVLCPAFDDSGGELGLAMAVVALDGGGVRRTRHGTMGLRGMTFGRLGFTGVVLDEDAVTLGTTMPRILTVVEWGQVVQAVCGLGLGRAALAEAEHFLADRASFGRPLGEHAAIRAQLEEARRELAAGACLARRAVATKAHGEVAGEAIVAAKIFCSEAGLAACQVALRVCGGWGYTTELAVERMVRDAHGNVPAGLPNDRLRELLIAPRVGIDPWAREG